MSVTITTRMLKRKGACPDQVKLFRELYGVSVTYKTKRGFINAALKAEESGLQVSWGLYNLIPAEFYESASDAEIFAFNKYMDAKSKKTSDKWLKKRAAIRAMRFAELFWGYGKLSPKQKAKIAEVHNAYA